MLIGPNHFGSYTNGKVGAWQDGFSRGRDLENPAVSQG